MALRSIDLGPLGLVPPGVINTTYLFFRMLSQACGFGCNDGAESAVFLAIQLIRRGCDFSTWLRPRLLSTL